jgi:hypothetical protein
VSLFSVRKVVAVTLISVRRLEVYVLDVQDLLLLENV